MTIRVRPDGAVRPADDRRAVDLTSDETIERVFVEMVRRAADEGSFGWFKRRQYQRYGRSLGLERLFVESTIDAARHASSRVDAGERITPTLIAMVGLVAILAMALMAQD
ncbi:MAG: hypothetical protein L6Q92_05320 [Phycisphaerae bacterium]|nr:hypothetical protein [Phycisphaerae bacterium]